jgi:hypothetical protein
MKVRITTGVTNARTEAILPYAFQFRGRRPHRLRKSSRRRINR